MYRIATVVSGNGNWVGTLLKEVDGRGTTEEIGGLNITGEKFHINLRKETILTAGEMVLLFAELLNTFPRASGFPFTLRVLEE
jgi:hypothetical protein